VRDDSATAARSSSTSRKKGKKGCPADSDFAFATVPTPSFSDRGAHGTVVVDAWVDVNGKVTKTKVLSNSTGDETLAFLTEREIKSAEFIAPVRNCVSRAFIYTYSRTF
jgi:TonB family protein